jgi:single-strand DNA-binding protein
VLQGFNGNLTMLDGRSGGGQSANQGNYQNNNNDFSNNNQNNFGGEPSWGQVPADNNQPKAAPSNFEKELDDEIPF